jgi:tetratricopeptide (TPR) repeat protein
MRLGLKFGAAAVLMASTLAGVRAPAESTLSIELPPSMLFENPYAKAPTKTTPPAPIEGLTEKPADPAPAAMPFAPEPLPAMLPPLPSVAELRIPDPPSTAWAASPAEELQLPPAQSAEMPPLVEMQNAPAAPVADVAPPADELPALPSDANTTASQSSGASTGEDILPLPVEPQAEMLDALESIWSEGADQGAIEEANGDPSANVEPPIPYTPTVAELSQQLLPAVRQAYGMAQRGALYAAQEQFVQILQRIAQAKDTEAGTDEHSRALAAGLRALDEADDFMPTGVQLEAELNVEVVASSHRTPVFDRDPPKLPHDAVALYHRYAEEQLGKSVAGERAGSMALYGLGKIHNRLANESESELRQQRKALAMFRAALVAGPDNYLAANEIGVLLARSGHSAEAATMFRQAIDVMPSSVGYHNLASVERKLGQFDQAAANEQYAVHLASRDRTSGAVSRAKGIEWVAPQDLARASGTPQPPPPVMGPVATNGPPPRNPGPRVVLPRGQSNVGEPSTAAQWPQKLLPFRR